MLEINVYLVKTLKRVVVVDIVDLNEKAASKFRSLSWMPTEPVQVLFRPMAGWR
jgi:hypothetical protein